MNRCLVSCVHFYSSGVFSAAFDHLAQLFDHLFNADVSILRDLALHLCEPLAQLLVFLIELGPLVQLLAHLLPAQGKLRRHGEDRVGKRG